MEEYIKREDRSYSEDVASVIPRKFLCAIPEVESIAETSMLNTSHYYKENENYMEITRLRSETSPASAATSATSLVNPIFSAENRQRHAVSWSPSMPDEMFKIRNLDTGEEVDIRDENKERFLKSLNKLLNLKNSSRKDLERYL